MNSESIKLQRVGLWWSDKKSRKFNIELLTRTCRQSGLELVRLSLDKTLEEQGPFAAILHKLSDVFIKATQGDVHAQELCISFKKYAADHPEVAIIDRFDKMEALLNRNRQYRLVEDSDLVKEGRAFVPSFVELTTKNVQLNLAKMQEGGVTFPCVCKSTLSHGCQLAHEMCIIFNVEGLKDVNPPCVLQTLINHNAVLYKLYVVGNKYFFMERPSLKNFSAGDYKTIFFHSKNISRAHSPSVLNELDEMGLKIPTMLPEEEKLNDIVYGLNQTIGLTLYGVDIIIDNVTKQYGIIDLNVFPGYDDVDNFFGILCDLIKNQMDLRSKGLMNNPSIRPVLCNSIKSSLLNIPYGRDTFTFVTPEEAVVPYSCKCYCCPINGVCSSEFRVAPHRRVNLNNELSSAIKTFIDSNKSSEILGPPKDLFCSPEDSGIETSDSCDEKKKKKDTELKSAKRQHSKSHCSFAVLEENVQN